MKANELIKSILKVDPNFELENTPGIYIIYCLVSEKAYVGKSKNIQERWKKHRTMLNCRRHRNPHLQNAWLKHGKNLFVFGVLEVAEELEKLADRERHYIDLLDKESRYNCQDIPNEDFNISESTRKKMSEAHIGKTLPQEQKEKISAALKGRQPSENTIAASRAKKGRPLSEEHKKALSLAKKGKRSSRASISDDLARQIYVEKKKTNKTCLEIAKENRVSLDIVKHITNPNSKSWTHIRG